MRSASSLSLNSNTSSSNSTVDTELYDNQQQKQQPQQQPQEQPQQQPQEQPQQSKTIYELIRLVYSRNDCKLLSYRGYNGFTEGDKFFQIIKKNEKTRLIVQDDGDDDLNQLIIENLYFVWEFQIEPNVWQGVVTCQFNVTDFEYWFLRLLVSLSRIYFPIEQDGDDNDNDVDVDVDVGDAEVGGESGSDAGAIKDYDIFTKMICNTFAQELKHTVEEDQWDNIGEGIFSKGVDFFTSRWQPLEAVLPAFPCKSSNIEKVSGEMPDKGEELALLRLIQFSNLIKDIYPPGIIIWIVSDGHVFSDCIAVDDFKVNRYFEGLQELYKKIKPKTCNPIRFCSLPVIFNLSNSNFNFNLVEGIELGHYLGTEIDFQSEICRKILVNSCDTDCGKLRQDITTTGHPRLALFRGFSKFMTEDLSLHPNVSGMTRKKFKKIVAKVAFEMIKRNDAYSNLVELMFPFHLRFSIHAHNNSGPKFGISLLSKKGENQCHPINSIQDHKEPKNTDLLHIPTPWHNSIVKINDSDVYFVIKSNKVKEEIDQGNGNGGWDSANRHYIFFSK